MTDSTGARVCVRPRTWIGFAIWVAYTVVVFVIGATTALT